MFVEWLLTNGNDRDYKRLEHLEVLDAQDENQLGYAVVTGDDHYVMTLYIETKDEWEERISNETLDKN